MFSFFIATCSCCLPTSSCLPDSCASQSMFHVSSFPIHLHPSDYVILPILILMDFYRIVPFFTCSSSSLSFLLLSFIFIHLSPVVSGLSPSSLLSCLLVTIGLIQQPVCLVSTNVKSIARVSFDVEQKHLLTRCQQNMKEKTRIVCFLPLLTLVPTECERWIHKQLHSVQ